MPLPVVPSPLSPVISMFSVNINLGIHSWLPVALDVCVIGIFPVFPPIHAVNSSVALPDQVTNKELGL